MNDQASQSGVSENLPSGKHVVHNESAEQWMVQPLRRPAYQRSSFRTWLYMVGLLLMLFSATLLPPMAVAGWYDGIEVVLPLWRWAVSRPMTLALAISRIR
ncbi:MAG: hypothetical protein KDJ22_04855 [Candidatus Competibacteraceae bacterium]|nr:hypothetical protein [Candidatus Competibacteraceae bacterium]MCP5126980.1 hypothetical protein [Gammaproteobacteria bacterium]HRX70484.1 hypothetical protein [Candidatus Competibacteraceae bacterium]